MHALPTSQATDTSQYEVPTDSCFIK